MIVQSGLMVHELSFVKSLWIESSRQEKVANISFFPLTNKNVHGVLMTSLFLQYSKEINEKGKKMYYLPLLLVTHLDSFDCITEFIIYKNIDNK